MTIRMEICLHIVTAHKLERNWARRKQFCYVMYKFEDVDFILSRVGISILYFPPKGNLFENINLNIFISVPNRLISLVNRYLSLFTEGDIFSATLKRILDEILSLCDASIIALESRFTLRFKVSTEIVSLQ